MKLTRRNFLTASAAIGAAAVASPMVLPGRVLGLDGDLSPNNKLTTALVGYGNRGRDLLGAFMDKNRGYQCLAVSDCFGRQAQAAKDRVDQAYNNSDCKIYPLYEDILADRKDIDVIAIASPDHWHTKMVVDSCKAGKDVFCEKPLTLTLAEGKQIVEGARKYNRVVSSGSQRVMEDYGYMAPIVQSGAIGDVKEVFCEVGPPPVTCYQPEQRIPEDMNWDRWLGQAPLAPYSEERSSGNYGGGWRRYEEYCNGFLADWGAHKFGGALYILGLDLEDPIEIHPRHTEKNPTDFFCAVFKNGLRLYHAWGAYNTSGKSYDIRFVGTEGSFDHNENPKPKPIKATELRRYSGPPGDIYQDFAYCVRNRLRPFQDVEYGARTAAFCQLLVIAYKLNRSIYWDQEKYQFIGDDQANRMISRAQRTPFAIEV
ncbi:MAG: Gfo/Idh/MocA family protein [Thermoguttaceae bacterium]